MDKIDQEIFEKMKQLPWDYTHLHDCICGSDKLWISEIDHPGGGMYCASVECKDCGREIFSNATETADVIWNRIS